MTLPNNTLSDLNIAISNKLNDINQWFDAKKGDRKWPIYHSLDMRIGVKKIVHVDSNLFPGGFHHLSDKGIDRCIELFSKRLGGIGINKILIVIENFTRNEFYFNNIGRLVDILYKATNAKVLIATPGLESSIRVVSEMFGHIDIHTIEGIGEQVFIDYNGTKWEPDFILMNNDMTLGEPMMLDGFPNIEPSLEYGWYNRRKSAHFLRYNSLTSELGEVFQLPVWQMMARNDLCRNVDFKAKLGLECLREKAMKLLKLIKQDYELNKIVEEPYLFLKADNGTFGMGIIEITDPGEIMNINKKMRHSLAKIKEGIVNSEIFIQEGIKTVERFDTYSAETMIYSVNGEIVGEIIRYNKRKNNSDSLNSKGMEFKAVNDFDINNSKFGYIKWLINKMANLSCLEELNWLMINDLYHY